MASVLPPETATALARAGFTYPEVGATADAELPEGYGHVTRSRPLAADRWREAVETLLTWRMHERAGLRVEASSHQAVEGAVVVMRPGRGALALRVPCRVVYLVDEPDRQGFAYGTLPGHPERGEELFVVERKPDGSARVAVRAFSTPATWLSRAGGPIGRWVQSTVTDRYLAVLTDA